MKLLFLALLVSVSALRAQASVTSVSAELVSEVVPIKYARAADVAATLLKMTTNGVATTTAASSPSDVLSSATLGSPAATIDEIQDAGQPPIIADERTNSLLIRATRQDLQRFKDTISRLDVAALQVLIEAAIIEVKGGVSNALGMNYLAGETPAPGEYAVGPGSTSRSNILSLVHLVSIADTNAAASQPGGFRYLAKPGTDLDALIPALATNSRVRVLQRPRIQTSDGVPASMFVGESRPYPTSSYYSGGATGPSSVQQLQVGVEFEVTPYVKPDGFVELDIHQKIERLAGTTNIANVGEVPITSSTEARAKVVVRDHETVLLGGLMETAEPNTPSGVPLLKDIPLLGPLFRRSSARTAPNEIIVLIRATVLASSEAATVLPKAKNNWFTSRSER